MRMSVKHENVEQQISAKKKSYRTAVHGPHTDAD